MEIQISTNQVIEEIIMKIFKLILVITIVLLTTLESQAQVTNSDNQNDDTLYNAQS